MTGEPSEKKPGDRLGQYPAVATSALGVVAGQITSYVVHTLWVFPLSDHGYHRTQLVAFLTIGTISLATHTLSMMLLLTTALGVHYLVAKVISVLVMFSSDLCSAASFIGISDFARTAQEDDGAS